MGRQLIQKIRHYIVHITYTKQIRLNTKENGNIKLEMFRAGEKFMTYTEGTCAKIKKQYIKKT